MRVIALDPGNKTGFAIFESGSLARMGTVFKDDLHDWLLNQICDVFVVENYRVFHPKVKKGYNNLWNTPFAVEVLGMVSTIGKVRGIEVVRQEPSIKPIGYGFLGMEYVKDKKEQHMQDAMAHGAYYLVKVKGVNPSCLKPKPRSNT